VTNTRAFYTTEVITTEKSKVIWALITDTFTTVIYTIAQELEYACFHEMCRQGSLTEGKGLSTVDRLVLTSLDRVLYVLKILFTFFKNKLPQCGGQLY
jgi:hypothetical protein